ncbi:MAG: hypothetical protein KDC68_04340, partial [Gelidibacter sp.]|nr:hypothetical protein [Gelidibacter sp.]
NIPFIRYALINQISWFYYNHKEYKHFANHFKNPSAMRIFFYLKTIISNKKMMTFLQNFDDSKNPIMKLLLLVTILIIINVLLLIFSINKKQDV